MEVYALDSLLRREYVIDTFESLIWTERFQAAGDFQLVIKSTRESREILKAGTRLAMNESYRIMTVETIEDATTDEGLAALKVTGPSLEATLKDRVAMWSKTDPSPWHLDGVPAYLARRVFHDICVTGILSAYDVIPYVVETNFLPASTMAEPVDPLVIDLPPTNLYEFEKTLCEIWNLGFRLIYNPFSGQLHFNVYSGSDRTSSQDDYPPVIFAEELDNLQNIKSFETIEESKNVAYVFSPAGFLEVYAENVPPDTDGFDRRVLLVTADDITADYGTTEQIEAALLQRGREELAKSRAFQAFDGEISTHSQYKYQRDYHLGDVVEMRGKDGVANLMRVTEQIFTSDKEGDKSYPTLALNLFVNTGSWLSWEANQTWLDLDADPVTWSELP